MSAHLLRSVGELGEGGLLRLIGPMMDRHTAGLPLGMGDDCAITPGSSQRLVWTIDSMVEGTHFRWWNHPLSTAESLARKLVTSNVSDLASKGARPLYGLLSLGVPAEASVAALEGFYRGLDAALTGYGCRLIGGDTVGAPQWVLTLALVGELAPELPVASRSKARPGMALYTSGPLGDSMAGLEALEGRWTPGVPEAEELIRAHLTPTTDWQLGRNVLSRCPDAAMMDTSDGLSKDANVMAALSGVALVIEQPRIMPSKALSAATGGHAERWLPFVLNGGEDYRLLFCTAEDASGLPVTRIGRVEAGHGLWLEYEDGRRQQITDRSFQHFRR